MSEPLHSVSDLSHRQRPAPAAGIDAAPLAVVGWPPSTGLLVSEVVTGGTSASDEFVEIYNASDGAIDLAGLEAGDRLREIGCGTGQATVPLAERGLKVTAIELGAELAAIARRRLAGFPAVDVVTSTFEKKRLSSSANCVRRSLPASNGSPSW